MPYPDYGQKFWRQQETDKGFPLECASLRDDTAQYIAWQYLLGIADRARRIGANLTVPAVNEWDRQAED